MTRQELLDVLKMAEEKQAEWLFNHSYDYVVYSDSYAYKFNNGIYQLAFELRDKAVKKGDFLGAAHWVRPFIDTDWMEYATPIEWIIAALIVLESEVEK